MENSLVLIVEDEPDIAHILSAYLEREGYRTVRAGDGETALQHHAFLSPDIVLLDARLPKLDGFSVLGRLRQNHNTPVIMITALAEDLDRLSGLRLGADDYIVKPFNPQEVVARVKAVLRRSRGETDQTTRRFGNFEVDLKAYTAFIHQQEGRVALQLTLSEFRILAFMIRRADHHGDAAAQRRYGLSGCQLVFGLSRGGAFAAIACRRRIRLSRHECRHRP